MSNLLVRNRAKQKPYPVFMNVLEAGLRVKRNKIIQNGIKMNARASFFYHWPNN